LTEVRLGEMVNRLVEYHIPEEDQAKVHVEISPHATLLADVRLLELSVGNLLSNAVKYGHPPYRIGWNRGVLSVSDQGPGIPAQHLPFVFDRLYRIDSSRQHDGHSHGLGLALVHSAMRAQGGEVRVRSGLNQGTTFELGFRRDA